VDIREVDPHDEVLLRRHWEVGKAAEDEVRPYDFHPTWEATRVLLGQPRDDFATVLLGAFEGQVLWGAAQVELPLHDNLHTAQAAYFVHPDRQRRGLGRALAEASYDVARERGRRTLVTSAFAPTDSTSPGLLFAGALGFRTALVDGMKVVDLPGTADLWDELEAAAARRHAGYRIVTWRERVPEEYLDGYCRLMEMFLEEAPMGGLELERERWDAERVRSRERRNARAGRQDSSAGAVAPDGTLVGITEVGVSEHAPWRGFQSGTIVAREHRGHSLGMAVKIANHRQLREHFPKCQVLMTGNADVNGPMNAVNEALGYREVERCVELQRAL
jgi:GNAT superfamily N-acetyltransferase